MQSQYPARRLPLYLTAAYTLLTIYACLYPLDGWRDIGDSPFAFLVAPWPRYSTGLDLVLNIIGYFPLGFVAAASLRGTYRTGRVIFTVTLACALLSLCLETAQNYLPTRVASNLDLATNTIGALAGAWAGVRWGEIFERHGILERWRQRRILHGHIGELGLILIALWWLTQLEPTNVLFGTGDLRPLFDLPAQMAFSARRYIALEAAIVAVQMLALGLVARRCMREPAPWLLIFIILAGLGIKMLATSVFVTPPEPWQWASPGAMRGLLAGSAILAIAWRLPGWLQHSLACLALLCATALVNLAPQNPFELAGMRLIGEGHFLNFHGVTRVVASLWPFMALMYLTAQGALAARR
ncbi:MAG TPA: VanZ family protein [Rhodocyclaceae bacterium]|nr:VanZ family protein [Rhodocyclaceae bacterium]